MSAAARTMDDQVLDAVSTGTAGDPFAVLGPHRTSVNRKPALVIRTMQPAAAAVELVTPDSVQPMTRIRREGLFELAIPGAVEPPARYRFRVHEADSTRE